MVVENWAARHGVSFEAMNELKVLLGALASTNAPPHEVYTSEVGVQEGIRRKASLLGARLWRNNVGAAVDHNGRPVRYGLANDSKAVNTRIKSSDLIGIRSVLIGPEHVGTSIGQFVAIEVKKPGWKYTGNSREEAQFRFLTLVGTLGGYAIFASDPGEVDLG